MSAPDPKLAKEIVRNFINSSITLDGLGDDENLFETGIVNSLFAVELMTFVERTFDIEIGADDLDIENFKSVNATAALIARKQAK